MSSHIKGFQAILFLVLLLSACATAGDCKENSEASLGKGSIEEVYEEEDTANEYFWEGKIAEAEEICKRILEASNCLESRKKSVEKDCARLLINRGTCQLRQKEVDAALTSFKQAEKRLDDLKKPRNLDVADLRLGLAECNYLKGYFKKALTGYKEALTHLEKELDRFSPDLLPVLEGLGGCYYKLEDYEEALPIFKRIAQIDVVQYGPDESRVGMSLSNLADVHYKLNTCDAARPLFAQSVWIFRKHNTNKLLSKYDTPEMAERYTALELGLIRKRIQDTVMGTANPPEIKKESYKLLAGPGFNEDTPVCLSERPQDFRNWRLTRRAMKENGFVLIDPLVKQKGLIVCLHGLGLHNGSYRNFAGRISKFGYGVVAFDVRGFGSLSHEKGFDKVDLNAGLEDLSALVSLIRAHNPGLPVFILGESMGGALALQFTARYPKLVDGLISSVPSGRRFKSRRTSLIVGLKLLENPNKPIPIGKRVVKQATKDEDVREKWINDPQTRLKLSPQELLHFQSFMNHNEQYAREIKDIPVIVFQGFKDHLVRPNGTYALYQALGTSEKDLMFVGDAEHLIFEEGQASDEIVSMLAAWLDAHISPARAKKTVSSAAASN